MDRRQKQVQASLIDGEAFKALFKLNDWNDVVIVAKGNHMRHYLNGRLILDFTDDPAWLCWTACWACNCMPGGRCAEFKDIRIKTLE